MTKNEHLYFTQCINDINDKIKDVNKGHYNDIFKTQDERTAFIQGLAVAIEPLEMYLGIERLNQ